jgi:hypothetical protein
VNSISPAAEFRAAPHFDWYHREKQALYDKRAQNVRRFDRNGKPIAKQIGKTHKITFPD